MKFLLELLEMSPVLGTYNARSVDERAQDWIDTHHNEIAAVAHLWDDGDRDSVFKYLDDIIKDKNLLPAVMDVMFH